MAVRRHQFAFEETTNILLSEGFPTKTVLCANDRIAFGVIAAAFQNGIKVGHGSGFNIRVAGHDNHPLSRYACPPITTVAQNYNDIGRVAIELLLEKLGNTGNRQANKAVSDRALLRSDLMLRQSA
ncbi:LacI family transcriptional regulator [Agrobacterium rubi]|nr:LacI family transcriptional regulator [Agrobacterium rubi]NTF22914.1 LacI family transcriptional regulator [Agrobacterium rubi]NTF29845.1 LacI family transcriptional regulator [Agrobacterium rubi]